MLLNPFTAGKAMTCTDSQECAAKTLDFNSYYFMLSSALGAVESQPKRPRRDVPLTTGGQNSQNFKKTPDETSKSYLPCTSRAAAVEPSATSYKGHYQSVNTVQCH